MDKMEIQQMLEKIKINCQFLTNIIHHSEIHIKPYFRNSQNFAICPISCINIIVQVSYLLYVCCLLKIDVRISKQPIFLKIQGSAICQATLVFYTAQEIFKKNNVISGQQKNFIPANASAFNKNILNIIFQIVKTTKQSFCEKMGQRKEAVQKINQFILCLKKQIEHQIMDNQEFPIIKVIQKTKLFNKYSNLLKIHASVCFYKIKHDNQLIFSYRQYKKKLKKHMIELHESRDYEIVCKMLDNFIFQLVNSKIIYVQKASSKDYRNSNGYGVGYVTTDQKVFKYEAKLITLDESEQKQGTHKNFKNKYILVYCMQNLSLQLKCITPIDPFSEQVDIICAGCSNICFGTAKIQLEVHQTHYVQLNKSYIKKNMAVKCLFQLAKSDEPFTLFLLLFDYATICTQILMEVVIKLGNKDQTTIIQQYHLKLQHYLKLFVEKAQNFYKNL